MYNHISCIHLLIDTWVAFGYSAITLLLTWMYNCVLETLLSVLLDKYPEVENLDNMVVVFLEEKPFHFIQYLFPFAIPPTVRRGSNFSTSLATLVIFCFLVFFFFFFKKAILTGLFLYLIVFFLFIFFLFSKVGTLFICFFLFRVSSLEKYLFKSFAHFWSVI